MHLTGLSIMKQCHMPCVPEHEHAILNKSMHFGFSLVLPGKSISRRGLITTHSHIGFTGQFQKTCMLLFDVYANEVGMAEEACASLPSALPQPCAQVAGAQVAPHAVKKRKRATENEGQAPRCNTGQPLLPHVTSPQHVIAAVSMGGSTAFTMKLLSVWQHCCYHTPVCKAALR